MKIACTSSDYTKVCQFDVDANEVIENIKALIEVEMGIPLNQQILIYNGFTIVDDSRTVCAL